MGELDSEDLFGLIEQGRYIAVLTSDAAKSAIEGFVQSLSDPGQRPGASPDEEAQVAPVAVAALNAFLQTNVTGPVLDGTQHTDTLFASAYEASSPSPAGTRAPASSSLAVFRRACLRSLDVDGVSPYPYISNIELFCLARWIIDAPALARGADAGQGQHFLPWLRLRVRAWHYKLLTQPMLGSGSAFTKSSQWSDVPTLQEKIEQGLSEVGKEILERGGTETDAGGSRWTKDDQVLFLVEKASICVMLGADAMAKEALASAAELHGFVYALSGALGKRTRYQEKSTSQLVVLAKSAAPTNQSDRPQVVPGALPLNDDTLLESIDFSDKGANGAQGGDGTHGLPAALRGLHADDQPQLSALDQIMLLAEATLKDAFSPADSLTLEEILPFAVRVVSDKSTNWQIYTQALLVRSRIEVHRGRTVERSVLQMQALVDQVVVDTTAAEKTQQRDPAAESSVPSIEVTRPDAARGTAPNMPTSFFPAPKPAESAPAQVRLQYIHALSSPPRWHLESELAYAWASVGSLVSALDIFKRLRLWAEVALCLASSAAAGDEDGRGSGGEEKARAVLRWQLYQSGASSASDPGAGNDEEVDISDLKAGDFTGPERNPPPAGAPRVFCILGDIENDPQHYERAWELSKGRFARAQKSLGEYYLRQKDLAKARNAYKLAVTANRFSPELWSRLGDISLRLGAFSDAAEAFGRAISAAGDAVGGEDARTWSNLGSALYSLYVEATEQQKNKTRHEGDGDIAEPPPEPSGPDEVESVGTTQHGNSKRSPSTLLAQALAAYKRGAAIAHGNWRIWDNVLTLASRMRPPAVPDMLIALHTILSVRKTEEAVDADMVSLLLTDVLLPRPAPPAGQPLPRGSTEKAICDLVEADVVPLITTRSELWALVARERAWRGDRAGQLDAAEKGWRTAVGGAGAGASLGPSAGERRDWTVDRDAWDAVVARTDELVSLLENYGPEIEGIGARWKGKAKSAVRSVMGKGREPWEGSEGWMVLERLLEGLA